MLADMIVDAAKAACDQSKTVRDCPFAHPTDDFSKACKIPWRVAYRLQMERSEVPLIIMPVRLAA
jgi:hypothetical protein